MTLKTYLKQFNNIVWYPSAERDSRAMVFLSKENLERFCVSDNEMPDCFLYTDYESHADNTDNNKFFLDFDEGQKQFTFTYEDSGFFAVAYNVQELSKLNIPFDQEMVAFNKDRYYGRVFTADVDIDHPKLGKFTAKLIYVIVENTSFAFNFLLKNHIKVSYVIHNCYGYGYGGGISNGEYMFHILKDLDTLYFVSDIDVGYEVDIAERYLSWSQKKTIPALELIPEFNNVWGACGDTNLYKVVGFVEKGRCVNEYFRS